MAGSTASLSGGGLEANSAFDLTMYSSPLRVASGRTDAAGSFTTKLTLPKSACVSGGLHRFVLSAVAPGGKAVTATTYLVLDDGCRTRNLTKTKPATNTSLAFGTFRFAYGSSKVTAYAKGVLKASHSALRTAKLVTIVGYTETDQKGAAAARNNKALSLRRARAVRIYLRSLGVKVPIAVVGAGGVNPVKGKPQSWNRRVVITVRY